MSNRIGSESLHRCIYEFGTTKLVIEAHETAIVRIGFHTEEIALECTQDNALTETAVQQLEEYFAGKREQFDLPLLLHGTDFQRAVWQQLLRIPYGCTDTYGSLAAAIGAPKAARAVGMACNRNPIAIVVPCHRVVGKSGALTGYAGGLNCKRLLLELEAK